VWYIAFYLPGIYPLFAAPLSFSADVWPHAVCFSVSAFYFLTDQFNSVFFVRIACFLRSVQPLAADKLVTTDIAKIKPILEKFLGLHSNLIHLIL
jgi:hypothetical protein